MKNENKDPFIASDTLGFEAQKSSAKVKTELQALYGENKRIADDSYDKAPAVKCANGTFVGKKTDGVIAFKGISFVGKQPVEEYRWKAPVDHTADDGGYEAFYNGKSPRQGENVGEKGSLYAQGGDCLNLIIRKADDACPEKEPVMVWIHGGAFEMGHDRSDV